MTPVSGCTLPSARVSPRADPKPAQPSRIGEGPVRDLRPCIRSEPILTATPEQRRSSVAFPHRIEQALQTILAEIGAEQIPRWHVHQTLQDDSHPHRCGTSTGSGTGVPERRERPQEGTLDPGRIQARRRHERATRLGDHLQSDHTWQLSARDAATQRRHREPAHDRTSLAPASRRAGEHPPMRHRAPRRDRCMDVVSPKGESDALALDRAPGGDDLRSGCIVDRTHSVEPGRAETDANPGACAGQILQLQIGVDPGDIARAPDDGGRRLVRFRGGFRKPSARGDGDGYRDPRRQRLRDARPHLVDDGLGMLAGRELGGHLIDRVHTRDGEYALDRAHHRVMHLDVALDPLGTHSEPRAAQTRITEPIARAHAGTLGDGVHRDQRRIGVRLAGHDTDGTPVKDGIGSFLAGGKKPVRVEIQPNRAHSGTVSLQGRATVSAGVFPSQLPAPSAPALRRGQKPGRDFGWAGLEQATRERAIGTRRGMAQSHECPETARERAMTDHAKRDEAGLTMTGDPPAPPSAVVRAITQWHGRTPTASELAAYWADVERSRELDRDPYGHADAWYAPTPPADITDLDDWADRQRFRWAAHVVVLDESNRDERVEAAAQVLIRHTARLPSNLFHALQTRTDGPGPGPRSIRLSPDERRALRSTLAMLGLGPG